MENLKYNILIVGVGALGKRHLSSILNSSLSMDVYCYDININALNGFEWEDKFENKSVQMINSFDKIPQSIDFAVFAMTSKDRCKVFDTITDKCYLKNILFEKVLFQKVDEYQLVKEKLEKINSKAWVNCARRQMDSYQDLKSKLARCSQIQVHISGGEWGLACNGIHFIDLIEFLSNVNDTSIDSLNLLPQIYESKRSGYKEVYGVIKGHNSKCSEFSVTCYKDSKAPVTVSILSDKGCVTVFESKQKAVLINEENNFDEIEFRMPYQSEMTQSVFEDIVLSGTSKLADYNTSARLHLQFVEPLIKFFNDNGWEEKSCPIT